MIPLLFRLSCYCVVIMLVCSCTLSAQGEYLLQGQSGLGVGGAITTNGDGFGAGGAFGYSVHGLFDFGFSLAHYSLNQKINGDDVSSIVLSPSITFHTRKDSTSYPIASVHASYQYQNFSSRSLTVTRTSLTGNFFAFGISILATFPASAKSYVQPAVDVSVVSGTTKLTAGSGYSLENTETKPVGIVSFSLISKTSDKTMIVLSPAVGFDKDNVTLGLSLALIFVTVERK